MTIEHSSTETADIATVAAAYSKALDLHQRFDVDVDVCVIGAGSSGLAAARHFVQRGFETQLLDREPDLGGNWNITNAHARVYDSTRMISSKRFTQYPDHPMPRDFPDYPHHAQVLDYLRSYAQRFDLLRSPHADKTSRDQLEIRTHLRLMDIIDPTDKTVDALMKLDLPAGVDVEIKVQ